VECFAATVEDEEALVTFVFLCVTGYVWASIQLGAVFGGLAMASAFLLIAVVGAAAYGVARARTRQRAIMERAARSQGIRALIDPKAPSIAMQAGRVLGWQRPVPLALLGFLAAQGAKEARRAEDRPDRAMVAARVTRLPSRSGTPALRSRH
jgi:hypothetical protein